MTLLNTPVIQAVSAAVIHFLWQGAVLAALLAVALPMLKTASTRYWVACSALLTMPLVFVATFASSITLAGPAQVGASGADSAGLAWVVPLWLVGVLLTGVHRFAGWIAVQRARREGVSPAPIAWQNRLRQLAERIGVSERVALLESRIAETPVVIGALRPVILVPAGLFAGLPTGQLEAILLHELAHVRRSDYLFNLVQSLTESLLFYHPAVWWVSGVIRAERENSRDVVVVAAQGDPHGYASALLALEERRQIEPALAATGGELMNRIRRLLNQPQERRSGAPLMLALFVGVFCVVAMAQQQSPLVKWLTEEVAYIITDRERDAFAELGTDEERDHFVEQFWERQDPSPKTRENEFKQEHYRRISYANERFASQDAGWKTDRGRLYIMHGPPDEMETHPGRETWRYRTLGAAKDIVLKFADPTDSGELRLSGGVSWAMILGLGDAAGSGGEQ